LVLSADSDTGLEKTKDPVDFSLLKSSGGMLVA